MSKFSDYLSLMRISLLPTAWSNVLLGYALSQGAIELAEWHKLALLILCSSCLYIGGMVLNDFFDYQQDKTDRPERALPSGRISRFHAGLLGGGLLLAAIAFSLFLSTQDGKSGLGTKNLATFITVSIVISVLLYNIKAKHTIFGPWVMGLCRSLNVLLGASLVSEFSNEPYIAAGVGIYVAGITLFAKQEHTTSVRKNLIIGALVMLVGVVLVAAYPWTNWFQHVGVSEMSIASVKRHRMVFVGLLAMMVFPVVRKAVVAIATCQPKDVKATVIGSLLTIIMIDASVCYLVLPGLPAYALVTASLILPAFLLTRRIMAT